MTDLEQLVVSLVKAETLHASLFHTQFGTPPKMVTIVVMPGHFPQSLLEVIACEWDRYQTDLAKGPGEVPPGMRVSESGLLLPDPFDCGPARPQLLQGPSADGVESGD